jgi:hypothetical protein
VGKNEGKLLFVRPRRRWKKSIILKIAIEGMDYIKLVQDRFQCRDLCEYGNETLYFLQVMK